MLEGSWVEIDLGFFSDVRPSNPPAWIDHLPAVLARIARTAITRVRAVANYRGIQGGRQRRRFFTGTVVVVELADV